MLHVRHDVGDGGPEGEAAVQGVGVQHGEGVAVGVVVPKVSFVVVKKAAWRRGKGSPRRRVEAVVSRRYTWRAVCSLMKI